MGIAPWAPTNETVIERSRAARAVSWTLLAGAVAIGAALVALSVLVIAPGRDLLVPLPGRPPVNARSVTVLLLLAGASITALLVLWNSATSRRRLRAVAAAVGIGWFFVAGICAIVSYGGLATSYRTFAGDCGGTPIVAKEWAGLWRQGDLYRQEGIVLSPVPTVMNPGGKIVGVWPDGGWTVTCVRGEPVVVVLPVAGY